MFVTQLALSAFQSLAEQGFGFVITLLLTAKDAEVVDGGFEVTSLDSSRCIL
jgi:hypothetical protein